MEEGMCRVDTLIKNAMKKIVDYEEQRKEAELMKTYELMKYESLEKEDEHNKNLIIEVLRQSINRNDISLVKLKKWKDLTIELFKKIERLEKEENERKEENKISMTKVLDSKNIHHELITKRRGSFIKRVSSPRSLIKVKELNKKRQSKRFEEINSQSIDHHLVFCNNETAKTISLKRRSTGQMGINNQIANISTELLLSEEKVIKKEGEYNESINEEMTVQMITTSPNDLEVIENTIKNWIPNINRMNCIIDDDINEQWDRNICEKIQQLQEFYIIFIDGYQFCIGFYFSIQSVKEWEWIVVGQNSFAFMGQSPNTIYRCPRKENTCLSVCFYNNYGTIISVGSPYKPIHFNKSNHLSMLSDFTDYFSSPTSLITPSLRLKRMLVYSIN
ncbi:hypothetical protein EDI_216610 [Entamoeba dispar SAW760]|uniref:Uncharacterized protein n=1 Tax=Entamoeba dispar (strain ATCC PRA-260 / SAW760) TaxID=370354 RepID=B0EKT2_ENTDS|nr:uncharacterized protein EDI_216610 [Entamoeba dispar SAW760]EDR24852.1 hypothetical protein EDI_216610 [Entamoeba dispar SAW760]|eukprot:EDR24852.1 hypothetical protein EDI_216610 [Entamoeba dispar SAW760]